MAETWNFKKDPSGKTYVTKDPNEKPPENPEPMDPKIKSFLTYVVKKGEMDVAKEKDEIKKSQAELEQFFGGLFGANKPEED